MKNKAFTKNNPSTKKSRFTDKVSPKIPKGVLSCSLVGVAVAVVLAVILSLLLAFVLLQTADPTAYVTPTALSVLYVSAFIGGFSASLINRGSAVLCGVTVGLAILALDYLLSFTLSGNMSADYGLLGYAALRIAIPVCSLIGAFIGVTKNTSVKNTRNNYKKR